MLQRRIMILSMEKRQRPAAASRSSPVADLCCRWQDRGRSIGWWMSIWFMVEGCVGSGLTAYGRSLVVVLLLSFCCFVCCGRGRGAWGVGSGAGVFFVFSCVSYLPFVFSQRALRDTFWHRCLGVSKGVLGCERCRKVSWRQFRSFSKKNWLQHFMWSYYLLDSGAVL